MALTANRDVKYYAGQELLELPLDDNVQIYKGAFVGLNGSTGYARPLVAGDVFVGVAYANADNTGAGHAAAAVRVMLHQNVDIVHAVASVTAANIGDSVYASDDGTLTLTATSNSLVGHIAAIESAGVARVRCQPFVA